MGQVESQATPPAEEPSPAAVEPSPPSPAPPPSSLEALAAGMFTCEAPKCGFLHFTPLYSELVELQLRWVFPFAWIRWSIG